MSGEESPLRRASGAQVVHGALRDRILSLALAPGTRLYESELAKELGVSRTPLREAIRLLLAEDLVVQQPTGGVVVTALDATDMRELYTLRAAIEGLLVREACARLDADDDAALAAHLAQMRVLVDHPQDLLRLGHLFHGRFAQASGNRRAQQLLHQIQGQVSRYQMLTNLQPPRRKNTLKEHRGIYEAARARDGELAEQRMRAHIMAAYQVAADVLEGSGYAS